MLPSYFPVKWETRLSAKHEDTGEVLEI
jgi:hypothetical protein